MADICVTGATGFIGRHLCSLLHSQGHSLRFALRREIDKGDPLSALGSTTLITELGPDTDWHLALHGVDAVVHLASRVHVMNEHGATAEALYQEANVLGSRRLAESALAAGVRHFIFISSVKAVGEQGWFDQASIPTPPDAYGRSKLAAEQVLHDAARGSDMALTVLRPPLVYGPGVGANFLRLLRLVDRRMPLPLATASNQRSLAYVGNLVSAIRQTLEVERSDSSTFFISDGKPVSTPDLIRAIASAMHKAPNLWPCPLPLLSTVAAVAGKQTELARLTESLVVDSDPFCKALGWTPPFTLQDGLCETIDWYSRQL